MGFLALWQVPIFYSRTKFKKFLVYLEPLLKIAVFGFIKRSHYCQGLIFFNLEHKETLFLRVYWEKANKNVWEFFGLKSWVTPLKNCDFSPYEKIPFLRSKNVSFLFRTWRNCILRVFWEKAKKKNVLKFICPKSWVNPFGELRFLALWKVSFFVV